ncbi:hypothetical protein D9M71_502610 [compost metagenome]
MSVATRMRTSLALKSARALVRAFWLLLPWIAAAARPCLVRYSARRLAPCLVRVKTSTCSQAPTVIRCASRARLWLAGRRNTRCSMRSTVVFGGVTSMRSGSCSSLLARSTMSFEKVAENSRFWRLGGSLARTFFTSWMKPMSSIRSASSSTRISTWERSTLPWPARSSRRPGQATSRSTPLDRACTWGFMPTPPKMQALTSFRSRA